MKLTAENVEKILLDCFFKSGEDTTAHVVGEGVCVKVGLHPQRLESHRDDITAMLNDLPVEFRAGDGGGWSFLNACFNKDGQQWADLHATVDKLVVLGNAIGKLQFPMPRDMWSILPGGMPYFIVK